MKGDWFGCFFIYCPQRGTRQKEMNTFKLKGGKGCSLKEKKKLC